MNRKIAGMLVAIDLVAMGTRTAYAAHPATFYDGAWHLAFTTRNGPCDTYDFDVNITNGTITHPNLVRFRGRVARNGLARASVTVQDKYASGSGRLSNTSGKGVWSGYSGASKCSGYWTAQKN